MQVLKACMSSQRSLLQLHLQPPQKPAPQPQHLMEPLWLPVDLMEIWAAVQGSQGSSSKMVTVLQQNQVTDRLCRVSSAWWSQVRQLRAPRNHWS